MTFPAGKAHIADTRFTILIHQFTTLPFLDLVLN